MDQAIQKALTTDDLSRLNPVRRKLVLFVGRDVTRFDTLVHVAEHLNHVAYSVATFQNALVTCRYLHPVPDVVVFDPDMRPTAVDPKIDGLEFAKRLPQQGLCDRIRLVAWSPSNSTSEGKRFKHAVMAVAPRTDIRYVSIYTDGHSDLRPLLKALTFDD